MFFRHDLLLLVIITFVLKLAVALNVDVPAHENECFYEELEVGDKMTLTFEVRIQIVTKQQDLTFCLGWRRWKLGH